MTVRPPRAAILDLQAYDGAMPPSDLVLAANESPFTLPEPLLARLQSGIRDFTYRCYPDPLARSLREKLAAANGVAPESILLGNGGDELLLDTLLAWGGPGRRVLVFPPTFSMYGIYAHTLETEVVELCRDPETFSIDVDTAAARLSQGDIDLCFVDTPNNPSGALTSEEDIVRLLEASDALIFVDEAYFEFSGVTALPLLERFDNLVILHTFSKAFSLAGLRLGYVMARPEVIATLAKVRMPYSVSAFSQWVGALVVEEQAAFEPTLQLLRSERERLFQALDALEGVQVWPSQANYLLFRVAGAHVVWQRLLDDFGIYIRDFSSAPGLTDCLRVTVGSPEQNDRFLQALADKITPGVILSANPVPLSPAKEDTHD